MFLAVRAEIEKKRGDVRQHQYEKEQTDEDIPNEAGDYEEIAGSDEHSSVEENNVDDNHEAENDEETDDEEEMESDKGKIGCHIIMMPKHTKIRLCPKAA